MPPFTQGNAVVTDLQFLEAPEHFLPVRRATLQERMLADPRLSDAERGQLGNLFEMIAARFHFEFHKKLEHLKTLYDSFDPDRDTLALRADPAHRQNRRDELARSYRQLLLDANYVEMPREQIIACAEHQSQTGLVVKANLSDYAQLQAFYRGIQHKERTFRLWLRPWRKRSETVHIFSRVALLVRLTNCPDGPIFLKLFKNVVAEDLEMLLPYVRIRMRLLDHVKIGSSVLGGVVTASWKMFTATILSPWLLLLVAAGFIGAAIRGLFGFLSRKTKYMHALSSNLYFQNLANNASALAHLVDSAEAEEHKELLLAYYILYVERDHDYTRTELGRRVERWLRKEFDLEVHLDVSDAVRKLAEKDLVVHRPAQFSGSGVKGDSPISVDTKTGTVPAAEVLKVYDLPSSLRRLDAVWDAYFSHRGVRLPEQDRLADADWPPRRHDAAEGAKETATQRVDAGKTASPRPLQSTALDAVRDTS
jgi:hypothetical protein